MKGGRLPSFRSDSMREARVYCPLLTARPYPGTIITFCAFLSLATSSADDVTLASCFSPSSTLPFFF